VADAEAIVEAALRPTMRFVAVKTEDQQARSIMLTPTETDIVAGPVSTVRARLTLLAL
jgi:hypothetical protein